jgi:serine/threonine-protein kinase
MFSTPADRCGIDGTQLIETDEDPLIGRELDQYEVVDLLGRGAMGCVYRGRHTVLSTNVAIKVLFGNFALNQRLVERFRREAQAIARMNHPNIVNVVDFRRTPQGLTFLLMELVEGITLERAIEIEGPFTPARTAHISRQIASGLGEAHRTGFVHRDMKPSNVMLTQADGMEVVKILDFGVVGLIHAATQQKLTVAGHIVGTPNYMAPEQARSSAVSPSADLYALGVIMYEMLTAKPPFEGYAVAEVLLKHINEQPPPLHIGHAGLQRLVMSLLEKAPEKRPTNAARVISEIDRLNLEAASTEQIMVSKVRALMPRKESDERNIRTEDIAPDDRSRRGQLPSPIPTDPAMPLVIAVPPPPDDVAATPPDPSLPLSVPGDNTQPTEAAPPVEPSLPRPPIFSPLQQDKTEPTLQRDHLDGPTVIDFRGASRPKIRAADGEIMSTEAETSRPLMSSLPQVVTVIPEPRPDPTPRPIEVAPQAAVTTPAEPEQARTVRDMPYPRRRSRTVPLILFALAGVLFVVATIARFCR